MDVGATLREARQRRAMSLEDLEQVTKIRKAFLDAIENNRKDRFPHVIYARGFVWAYAREVGLDADDVTRRYFEQFEPPVDDVESSDSESLRKPPAPAEDAIARDARRAGRGSWQVAALLFLVGAVLFSVARWKPRSPQFTSHAAPSDAATRMLSLPIPDPAPDPPAETGTSGAAAPAGDHVLHFDIRADGSCWLSATADGTRVMNQLMQSGEQHVLDVRQEAILRVGDPSAFAFSINGMSGRPLGRPGEAVTVHITNDNYREFLRR